MSFSSFSLAPAIYSALEILGFEKPTDIQSQTIPLALTGKDIIATAQTGTGKTAAFMLPILNNLLCDDTQLGQVRALVLAPTRELAQQVAENTQQYAANTDLKVVCLYGGANIGPQEKRLKAGVDIVVATPGRLLDHLIKGTLSLSQLQHLVFDEADRMLDMGFIGEIKRIMRHVPDSRQTMLFSATLDESVEKLASRWLSDPKRVGIEQQNTTVEAIEQTFYAIDEEKKAAVIAYLIGKNNWQQVLVFTRTKAQADSLVKELIKDGLPSSAIHGDKSQGARDKGLTQFKEGKVRVLVATDVAARGIDISTLDYVINAQLPYVAEDYIHRIGRTGRAGRSGKAISLVSQDEQWLLEELEVLLDERLTPQWLSGFEPDLTREVKDNRKNTNKARKDRDKKRVLGQRQRRRR
ncbi:DEAD/DEAH box helicase [Pseudoalteromonas phenolica]|uniref:DEAD-box ATP-dependent RNA helicase RhpA n=1 Tax=Pseudoalteromonas phenolica TaxID=161398 RepID=A0A4Q7IK41_9GAMM|nr:DEAD/DEAH box helicase [Pseudoalteromonas phenolica]RZQ51596.1 DEAD/DEAH box helicase [Pseudoalteromonas phenolica]